MEVNVRSLDEKLEEKYTQFNSFYQIVTYRKLQFKAKVEWQRVLKAIFFIYLAINSFAYVNSFHTMCVVQEQSNDTKSTLNVEKEKM